MARTKKRVDEYARRKFSSIIREDLFLDLHKIRLNRGLKIDLYELLEDAVEAYVEINLPDAERASTRKKEGK